MKIINKTMDLNDLKTEKAKLVIEELQKLIKEYEEKGGKISSWYGQCKTPPWSVLTSTLNRGYDYQPVLSDKKLDFKFPSFLLWEIYWIYSNLNIKKGDTVLDIGGACSLFSFYLASKGAKVIAIDLNRKIVKEANRTAKIMGIEYKAVCADAEEYLLNTKEKFDYITSVCVFEHIEINKRKRIVKNIDKCLNNDGVIAFTFDYKNPSRFVRIDTEDDVKAHFLCNEKLYMLENQDFHDNNINYLISVFYRKPILWTYKTRSVILKEFPMKEYFKTKNNNDYTFGAIFLKAKNENDKNKKITQK